MFTNTFISDNHSKNTGKSDFLSRFHRFVCIFSLILTAFCLLRCIASYEGALQDMRKYEGLGFSYPVQYYLEKNCFLVIVGQFLWVTCEFLLYIVQCRWAHQKKSLWGSLWYFYVMLVFHTATWLHANSIVQGYPPPASTCRLVLDYRTLANISILPALLYSLSYTLRVHKLRLKP